MKRNCCIRLSLLLLNVSVFISYRFGKIDRLVMFYFYAVNIYASLKCPRQENPFIERKFKLFVLEILCSYVGLNETQLGTGVQKSYFSWTLLEASKARLLLTFLQFLKANTCFGSLL